MGPKKMEREKEENWGLIFQLGGGTLDSDVTLQLVEGLYQSWMHPYNGTNQFLAQFWLNQKVDRVRVVLVNLSNFDRE